MAYNDIEYLVRFFASSYGNSVNTIHTYERVGDYLMEDPGEEDLQGFYNTMSSEVENNSVMASAALASLVEIKQAIPEEEWFALQLKMPEVLKPLDGDIARYEALLAFHKADLPLPGQGESETFDFGKFEEPK